MGPEHLFKYGSLNEYSKDLFTTPTLYFSSSSQFNDPFECRPRVVFDGDDRLVIASFARSLMQRDPTLSAHDAVVEANVLMQKSGNLQRRQESWNDLRQEMIKRVSEEVGMFCLSAVGDSILMWSHYAKMHQGYCIQFESGDHTPFFGRALPVKYQDEYPEVVAFKTIEYELAEISLLTKSSAWSYEQEHRIMDFDSGKGPRTYPAALMKSICFGLRMPAEDRAAIRSWVEQRSAPVAFYEAVQDPDDYRLLIRPA